jgi:hypothetical protein
MRGIEASGRPAWWAWAALASGSVALLAPWGPFFPAGSFVRVVLQLVWLAIVPVLLALNPEGRRVAPPGSAL